MRTQLLALLIVLVACSPSGSESPQREPGEVTIDAAAGPIGAGAGAAAVLHSEGGEAASEWVALGYDLAAKMPLKPHIKNRARFQAVLLGAAMDAGLLDQAAELAAGIPNWRKGLVQASVASAYAQEGKRVAAIAALAVAAASEAELTEELDQGWRRDRVRAKIAETYAYLGQPEVAARIQSELTPSEAARLAPLSARGVPVEKVAGRVDTLQQIASAGDLEQVQFALLAMAEFYGAADVGSERRVAIEKRIRMSWTELPILPRVEILQRMVELDVEDSDLENARFAVDEIASLVEENRWNAEEEVALRGRVAKLLAKVDDSKGARKAADDALALFETSRESIVSIWRGGALRPLAEAYLALGDNGTASALYQRALDEAMINPNGRPRMEDVIRTIASMTRQHFSPDAALARKLRQIAGEIDAPW